MPKPRVIALILTDTQTSRLGLTSLLEDRIRGRSVLEHTLARVAKISAVQKIVLVHPSGQRPLERLKDQTFSKPVETFEDPEGLTDAYHPMRRAARKWSLTAWRGGLGGATCYDELLPAGPLLAAMLKHKADAALLVGADWLLVDPGYCSQVIDLHLQHPEAMQMTFTQAPPGLAGIAVGRSLIEDLTQNHATFGTLLSYNPTKPQADPIGRDVCVQIPAAVRGCAQRFIYDTPASAAMIRWIAQELGDRLVDADAAETAQVVSRLDQTTADGFANLPQQVTLELTPRRHLTGPVTPHHHVSLDRPDMPLETALRLVRQLGHDRDLALTLGGLGDALLYEHWAGVVEAAHDAGVLGIAIETDLLVDTPVLELLLELPIDVITVRLHADTAKTYIDATGGNEEDFTKVIGNLQWLLTQRNRRAGRCPVTTEPVTHDGVFDSTPVDKAGRDGEGSPGLPWIVPQLVKTRQTLGDLETFFDRWVHFAGHAVIEPASTGCGLMPELSPVRMAPPKRLPCRQLQQRMTIHSDGRVALCDQDWLGRGSVGDARSTPLTEIWRAMRTVRDQHDGGRWDEQPLCAACHEWHRP